MQKLLIDVASHVFDQSDKQVHYDALDRLEILVVYEIDELLDDLNLVQNKERVAEAECLDLFKQLVELLGVVLELLSSEKLDEVRSGQIVAVASVLHLVSKLIVLQMVEHCALEAES